MVMAKKRKSPMAVDFWIDKGLTEVEAKLKIKSQRKMNTEYWTVRGYSITDAELEVKKFQQRSASISVQKQQDDPEKYAKNRTTNLAYWLKKGYSEEEAIINRAERQRTFTLDKCIQKHGEIKGHEIWQTRQDKWQKTLGQKTDEETTQMNKKKDCVSLEYFMCKFNGDVELALRYHKNAVLKRMVLQNISSKAAFKTLVPLYKQLRQLGILQSDIYWGVGKSKECD